MRIRAVIAIVGGVVAAGLMQIPATAAGGKIQGTVKAAGMTSNADAIVYIVQAPGKSPAPAKPAEMNQRSLKFTPHVVAVVAGSTVRFLNSDSVAHNVFSPDHEKYDLGTWSQGQPKDHIFATCAKPPCVYVQLCRIHPEMEGYVVVLQNQFFAVTTDDGRFQIDDVPPGSYSVAVWHPKGKAQPKPVTVDVAKPLVVDFTLGR